MDLYLNCRLCPRDCGVNRLSGERGFCRMPAEAGIGRVSLHHWEEPCLSGSRGSGTVFFTGCSLGCIYCQNRDIISGSVMEGGGSQLAKCKAADSRTLADYYLKLQEAGAHNINLVTAGHYLPHIVESLKTARAEGLQIPVIYNTSGYEKVSSLRLLEGLVDIYLTDFRYFTAETAARYSRAPDYPERAMEALREMIRQRSVSYDPSGMLRSGVIVRILLLPGHVREARQSVHAIHEAFGAEILLSLLNQYTPMPRLREDPLLGRKVTKREYDRLLDYVLSLGISDAYIQEGDTAEESFIPVFDGGVHL